MVQWLVNYSEYKRYLYAPFKVIFFIMKNNGKEKVKVARLKMSIIIVWWKQHIEMLYSEWMKYATKFCTRKRKWACDNLNNSIQVYFNHYKIIAKIKKTVNIEETHRKVSFNNLGKLVGVLQKSEIIFSMNDTSWTIDTTLNPSAMTPTIKWSMVTPGCYNSQP